MSGKNIEYRNYGNFTDIKDISIEQGKTEDTQYINLNGKKL